MNFNHSIILLCTVVFSTGDIWYGKFTLSSAHQRNKQTNKTQNNPPKQPKESMLKSWNKVAMKIEIIRCKLMKIHPSFYFHLRYPRSSSVTVSRNKARFFSSLFTEKRCKLKSDYCFILHENHSFISGILAVSRIIKLFWWTLANIYTCSWKRIISIWESVGMQHFTKESTWNCTVVNRKSPCKLFPIVGPKPISDQDVHVCDLKNTKNVFYPFSACVLAHTQVI